MRSTNNAGKIDGLVSQILAAGVGTNIDRDVDAHSENGMEAILLQ
jgi:hypothetical protein